MAEARAGRGLDPADYESEIRVSTASTQYNRVPGFSELRLRFSILSREAGCKSIGVATSVAIKPAGSVRQSRGITSECNALSHALFPESEASAWSALVFVTWNLRSRIIS